MIAKVRTDPFIFRGKVSESGYEWLKGADGKLRLVPRRVAGMGFRDHELGPALFLEFAKMPPTKEAIQQFATLHGDLFDRYDQQQRLVRSDGTVAHGASLQTWTQEIDDMRIVVGLWECVKYRQLSVLRKVIRWTAQEVGYVLKSSRRRRNITLAHAGIPETGFARFSPKDVLLPARYALQREINARLEDRPPFPRLAWTSDNHQRIVISSPDLLTAMWLQFAYAVTEEFQLRECQECGKYFQVGPGGRRADSTTCSDACRVRKHRRSNEKC